MSCKPLPAARPPGRPNDLESLQAFLAGLVGRARSIGIARYEEVGYARLLGELVPQVSVILMDALNILDCLLVRYDTDAEGERDLELAGAKDSDFFRRIDHLMVNRHSAERIADLSFMARCELRSKLGVLENLGSTVDSWQIVAVCDSSLRKLTKAVAAVEAALCEHEGCVALLVYGSELGHSLEVRRVYGKLRRDLRDCGKRELLAACLQGAATSIAKLIGRDIYAQLRISDRVHLRSLQERIVAWHRAPVQDLPAGARLWQDLWAFAHLLLEVNKRQELVEHDRAALDEISRRLRSGGGTDPEVRRLLDSLFGRDEELDLCLLGDGPLDVRAIEGPLRRLCNQQERTAPPEPPPIPEGLGYLPRAAAPNNF